MRELKVLVTDLQKQLTHVESGLQKQIDQRFDAYDQKTDAQFKALMSAFGEFKAQSELTSIRVISQLSERVAV